MGLESSCWLDLLLAEQLMDGRNGVFDHKALLNGMFNSSE
jgi:hypothetical protein